MTDSPSASSAIDAALTNNWKEAVRINTALVKEDKTDIDAHNRLGYAFLRLGEFAQAKRMFEKVLKIDQYNQIALKNVRKLSSIKRKDVENGQQNTISPLLFLEDPGKTKIADCVHLAPMQTLSSLSSGQEVFLKPKRHCVEIRDGNNVYLAALPDDLSFKLIKLITSGNRYQVLIKGVGKNVLTVFLREVTRGKKFSHQPSFISTTSYIPFAKLEKHPQESVDITPTGEENETLGETDEEPS